MIEDIVGNNGSRFIIAAGAVALGLLCLVAVFWFIRNRPSSPFIRGGKNRQPRLAVLDAAAIDTRRRLVLVRRDDVEHLIMIGGPTDVVIESRIASAAQPPVQAIVTEPRSDAALAARPSAERSLPERPAADRQLIERQAADRRIAPQPDSRQPDVRQPDARQPDVRQAPVSAMGQVFYGESTEVSTPPARAVQPVQQPRIDTATPRQAVPERMIPAQAQVRPNPTASQHAASRDCRNSQIAGGYSRCCPLAGADGKSDRCRRAAPAPNPRCCRHRGRAGAARSKRAGSTSPANASSPEGRKRP